jgi:DNA-binding NarL/FixJ family response regulator
MIDTARILIIEDDLNFKKLLEIRLKSIIPSIEIDHFSSIQSAIVFLEAHIETHIDLVVLDQHLPDGRGLQLLTDGHLEGRSVLSVSSDDNPDIPAENIKAGAAFFLSKTQVSQPLFKPLIHAIIERGKFETSLKKVELDLAVSESVKTLVDTLRHEINNPLGAVLGGAFLLKCNPDANKEQIEAAELIEQSGQRIKHVLDQIVKASEQRAVSKSDTKVFHIPGDKSWQK